MQNVFGGAADNYDAARPGYHEGLVGEVLRYAGPGHRTAVEVGAGTGKATVLFAAAGVEMTCVEPDPKMAQLLRANAPEVSVEVCAFEDWSPGDRPRDMLLAATSWHWTDPVRRWDLAAAALNPDGIVAIFWNPVGVIDPALHADLARVNPRDTDLASGFGVRAGDWDEAYGMWPEAELEKDPRFGDVTTVRFREEISYATADYLKLLDSTSTYRLLDPAEREKALAAVGDIVDRHGGVIHLALFTDVCLARKARPTFGPG
ncbi:class I SAM-dependent methyltransferase [Actinoplanes sp. TBRC 11911]|uniref:class I SAM-dependent methyltransferase n=1 Tax=Actinoplanes sp. TBRC 11911 TaxID=2729386 RepID=UPI00145F29D3|nr:class I SAM-dependent methyltransferase [Actinoplanes sp. TBRC 11911]NMO55288.1 class I SAM-dependent methyltransferase [Actinoplanes sp. TBRC 11911]